MSGMSGNWAAQREKKAYLALADGTVIRGWSCGASVDRLGEVVFNTGMTGYEEILTDPSYSGQLVTLTQPEIGNTGFNREDYESRAIHAAGLLIREMNPPSNWRSEETLQDALMRENVPALAGVDTRADPEAARGRNAEGIFVHNGFRRARRRRREGPVVGGARRAGLCLQGLHAGDRKSVV